MARVKRHYSTGKTIPLKVFIELKEVLEEYHIASVAEQAGVSEPTLYFWLDGTTRFPRLDTVVKVATAIGYELRLVQAGAPSAKRGRRHLRVVK